MLIENAVESQQELLRCSLRDLSEVLKKGVFSFEELGGKVSAIKMLGKFALLLF